MDELLGAHLLMRMLPTCNRIHHVLVFIVNHGHSKGFGFSIEFYFAKYNRRRKKTNKLNFILSFQNIFENNLPLYVINQTSEMKKNILLRKTIVAFIILILKIFTRSEYESYIYIYVPTILNDRVTLNCHSAIWHLLLLFLKRTQLMVGTCTCFPFRENDSIHLQR